MRIARRQLARAALAAMVLACSSTSRAQERVEGALELRPAVRSGLQYLAAHQNAEGSFRIATSDLTFEGEQIHIERAPIAVTALGALAFMSYGTSPRRGEFAATLRRALDYLLAHIHPPGTAKAGYFEDLSDRRSRMHGHGFATLALSQAYGQYRRNDVEGQRLRTALRAAVKRIQLAQSPTSGGWYYDPLPGPHQENSITITVVQALRAARDAGISVDRKVIDRALDYVRRCRAEDGSFRYDTRSNRSTIALTAASISTLVAMGVHERDGIDQAIGYIARTASHLPGFPERDTTSREYFPYYERLYIALAYYRHPDQKLWKAWFPRAAARLLREQDHAGDLAGSWPAGGRRPSPYGRAYETAVNCLVLAMPFGYLPAFRR